MKLRYFIIFMVLFTILCLIPYPLSTYLFQHGAYAVNDKYAIRQENEGFYIVFPENSPTYTGGSLGPAAPEFQSVKDMKDSIIAGNISSTGMAAMVYHFPKNDSGHIICLDLENLYDTVLPENTGISSIAWRGDYCVFYFTYPGCYQDVDRPWLYQSYLLMIDSEEIQHFSEYVNAEYYKNLSTERETYTYIKSEHISERNATAHYYTFAHSGVHYFNDGDYIDLWYQLEKDGKTIYVAESYELADYQNGNYRPRLIQITGKQDDVCFKAVLYGCGTRPTEDWLLSFGLKPYVE